MIGIIFILVVGMFACVGGLVAFTGWTRRRIETAVPPPGRFVEVAGTRLHYVDEGTGPVILMIHGLGSQLQTFTYALSARLRGRYRLLMLDRPGSGYSLPAAAADLTTQADLVAAFLRALGVDRALVVGHSLGGAIALALALDHPEHVAGLALLAPATQPQDDVPAALKGLALRGDLARWIVGWTVVTPLNMIAGKRTLATVFSPDPVPRDFGTRAGGLLQIRPSAFRNASRDLVEVGAQLRAYAARQPQIEMPVGVLFGTGDAILDPLLHGEGLGAKVQGLDLELVEGGGHMVPIAAPDRTAAFIERIAEKAFAPAGAGRP